MTKAARTPLRLHPAIPIAIICAGLALFVYTISFIIPFALTGQAYAVIAMLLGFRYWPPMARWVIRMPVAHRVVFGLLIAAMIFGHLTVRSRAYYPFITWCIFPVVREDDPVTCRELIATTASGRKVRLLVEQLFPSIVQIYSLEDSRYDPPSIMEDLVRAMAKVYNEHHANDPVRHVDLMVMAVKLHPPANESRAYPSCEFLKRYDISSGR